MHKLSLVTVRTMTEWIHGREDARLALESLAGVAETAAATSSLQRLPNRVDIETSPSSNAPRATTK